MLCAFVHQRVWVISIESHRNRPNCQQTKYTEHASKKIRPSLHVQDSNPPKMKFAQPGIDEVKGLGDDVFATTSEEALGRSIR